MKDVCCLSWSRKIIFLCLRTIFILQSFLLIFLLMVSSQCVTLSYSSENKPRVISSEGFSALEKNTVVCLQRDVLPIQSGITPRCRYSNGRLAHYFFEFELAGSVVGARCRLFDTLQILKSVPTAITICSGLPHLTRSLSRIVCRGYGRALTVEKALWGPISRPILYLCFFKQSLR